jgi:hypothetical protein
MLPRRKRATPTADGVEAETPVPVAMH